MADFFHKDRTVIGHHIIISLRKANLIYENAMEVIRELHDKFGGSSLFGNEKDDSFKSSSGQIYQTFGGVALYSSVEEQAAMLLEKPTLSVTATSV